MTSPAPYAGSTAAFPDLQSTQTMPADRGLLSDWTEPMPPTDPNSPGASSPPQAPWGPADYT